jgi:uncharacterized protein (TIGR02271 family)
VHDYVLDDQNRLRYLVVDTGFWIFGKKILVPVGQIDVREGDREVVVCAITKEQAKNLPAYEEGMELSPDYETRVMGTLHPEETVRTEETGQLRYENYDAFRVPQRLRLVEEHLQAFTQRQQVGEVHIRKERTTHTETVEVPVTEERIVIEHNPVQQGEMGATTQSRGREGMTNLEEGEITIPVYKDQIQVTKTPVVTEEVTVRKEQESRRETVQSDVTRENLVVENEGGAQIVDNQNVQSTERTTRTNRDTDLPPRRTR